MTSSSHAALARSFDRVAAEYAASRPTYPPELFDAVEELSERSLTGATVIDVGAGTGIGTRLLGERGARVTAVEPGAGMAAQFGAALPAVPLVRADGNALPFADGAADFVTYAQAWHWTDPARSVPEALRVLRPDGALAMWWNMPDLSHRWIAAQEARLAERCAGYRPPGFPQTVPGLLAHFAVRVRTRSIRWSRRITVDDRLRTLATHSFLAVMGAAADPVLRAEREELRTLFPDGTLDEPYVTNVTVAHRA
ncbi:class I SAM-dependent methyltransferase [Streptomyces sp. SPB162]|uniref:class I SAM-dependent methyltransferase n=1 Tax=Streptomyces sp. SPB162 TaxID=2940560 RepID=UPI002406B3F1|nr:class I SAM-dependent methyltransferase [Streptomyces sp. SPB162]MDF9814849.1 SAM-dependent methyltransferase [Streptomyces sp. SPB162]